MRRRNQPSGPTAEVPVASNTCCARMAAARRTHFVRMPVEAAQADDRVVLVDPRAAPRGRLGQALPEPAHVHAGALLEHHAAEVAVGADLGVHLRARHHARVRVDMLRQQCLRTGELVVMLRLGGQLELSHALEVAVDVLLAR